MSELLGWTSDVLQVSPNPFLLFGRGSGRMSTKAHGVHRIRTCFSGEEDENGWSTEIICASQWCFEPGVVMRLL